MKIEIVSDGTPMGTRVKDMATGDMLRGVQAVGWHVDFNGTATAMIRVKNVPVRLIADLDPERSTVEPMTGGADDLVLEDTVTLREDEHDHPAPQQR